MMLWVRGDEVCPGDIIIRCDNKGGEFDYFGLDLTPRERDSEGKKGRGSYWDRKVVKRTVDGVLAWIDPFSGPTLDPRLGPKGVNYYFLVEREVNEPDWGEYSP